MFAACVSQVLCRFSDAGTHDANHALSRPASEKRQGTKSRVGNGGGAATMGISPRAQASMWWNVAAYRIRRCGWSAALPLAISVSYSFLAGTRLLIHIVSTRDRKPGFFFWTSSARCRSTILSATSNFVRHALVLAVGAHVVDAVISGSLRRRIARGCADHAWRFPVVARQSRSLAPGACRA
jgi:hypothetical protein